MMEDYKEILCHEISSRLKDGSSGSEDEEEEMEGKNESSESENSEPKMKDEDFELPQDDVLDPDLPQDSHHPQSPRGPQNHMNKLEILLQQNDIFTFLSSIHQSSERGGPDLKTVMDEEWDKLERLRRLSSSGRVKERLRRSSIGEEKDNPFKSEIIRLEKQPSTLTGGTLKFYQQEGLNWILRLYMSGMNGILADEMGLGKTIQTIAALAQIELIHWDIDSHSDDSKDDESLEERMTEEKKNRNSFHLIIVPKITLANWRNEIHKWMPSLRLFEFYGNKQERELMKETTFKTKNFDCILTTYDICRKDFHILGKLKYEMIIIDEAHNIKNDKSVLSQVVRKFKGKHRLLLTGTPLQNNLHELWALLNFLMPEIFDAADDFTSIFDFNTTSTTAQESIITQIHRLLRPFMLRRLKSEVEKDIPAKREYYLYVGLSRLQSQMYKNILTKNVHIVNGFGDKVTLLNILMQLKKVCNHPYLFDGVEPGPPYIEGEHLALSGMKFQVLDKLLPRLFAAGDRVLIFSQMTHLLDIMDDYLRYRGWKYCRIDGQTSALDRELRIEDFQRPYSDQFIFLLSTRAGGCGINLHSANVVIIYDSDWNPQVDLQAIDRAHRIGQTREVTIYRFVTEGSVEEKIQERATKRLKLENLIMQKGRFNTKDKVSAHDVVKIIQFGAQKVLYIYIYIYCRY